MKRPSWPPKEIAADPAVAAIKRRQAAVRKAAGKKPKRKHPEDDLSKAVAGAFAAIFDPAKVWWSASANGMWTEPRIAKRMHDMGMRPGQLDFEIIPLDDRLVGQVFKIELKAAKGTLTPEQACVVAALAKVDGVAVCRSLDEVLAAVRRWGIPTRIAQGG